jgi:transcriptional regulator with XRE-family HTH domain
MTDELVKFLTSERTLRGLSMREVARRAEVSPACVHSWEHGQKDPCLKNLRAWAKALGFQVIVWPDTTVNPPAPRGSDHA